VCCTPHSEPLGVRVRPATKHRSTSSRSVVGCAARHAWRGSTLTHSDMLTFQWHNVQSVCSRRIPGFSHSSGAGRCHWCSRCYTTRHARQQQRDALSTTNCHCLVSSSCGSCANGIP
jgi:hypothetical protein